MRCKKCNYRLWNLPARRCPECGTPFRPSEFEFVPNSVRFCCPHCGQAYYGTSPNGHLVPAAAFSCVTCGRPVHMDDMILQPADGLPEDQTAPRHVPWLERDKRGFWRAWLGTIGMAMVSPGQLIRALPRCPDAPAGVAFALLTLMPAMLFSMSFLCAFPLFAGIFSRTSIWGGLSAVVLLPAAMNLIVLCLFLLLWVVVTHGILRLLRGANETLSRTTQALCFSAGAGACMAFPCFGPCFGWIWWLISAILMVKESHRTTGGKATAAVIALPGLTLLTLAGGYGVFIYAIVTGMGPFAQITGAAAKSEAQTVVSAIQSYADDHQGRGPDHAARLLATGQLSAGDFVVLTSQTGPEDIPVANTTLDQLETSSSDRQAAAADMAARALPPGTIAHRLGDFVFTYHGIDLDNADPRLWVVILSPDPDCGPVPQQLAGEFHVGQADGTVKTSLGVGVSGPLLQKQNALRAQNGLPPLPDPRTVTHTQPAVAPGWSPSTRPATSTAPAAVGPWIRFNHLGYLPDDPKIAVLSSDHPLSGTFTVGDFQADVGPDCGPWGPFRHNYRLDLTAVRRPGTYRFTIGSVTSPPFRIADDAYKNLPDELLGFMRLQRCGHNPITGEKCHQADGIDTETHQPVDLVGGWHDAADRLKHMITTTYCTAALFLAGATDEARHGAALVKKSHPDADTIYVQVGDDRDHLPPETLWHDDRTDYGWGPGGPRAAWPATGRPQGPRYHNESTGLANLAGRAAAAMALAGDIETSESLYNLAKAHPGTTMSVPVRAPYWYAERDYFDDLEWAAAELYIATRQRRYLDQAVEYADRAGVSEWMSDDRHGHYEFFPYVNLAHWRLYPHVDAETKARLAGYYRAGLESVRQRAEKNPYRLGTPLVWCSTNDVVAVATQAVLYEKMTGDKTYRPLAAEARDWIFGRNPWGVSFVIGVPTTGVAASRPHHLFHKLANILPTGGLVDGPVYPDINARFEFPDMGPDPYARFQSDVGVYHDSYADFSTNEPTIDGTTSLLLLLKVW